MRSSKLIICVLAVLGVQVLNTEGPLLSFSAADAKAVCAQVFEGETPAIEQGIGRTLYDTSLTKLEDFFLKNKTLSSDALVDKILKTDLRIQAFRLQAVSKVYSKINEEFFGTLREEFKSVEDAIGRLDLVRSLREKANKIEEPTLVSYFEIKESEAKNKLLLVLKEAGWLHHPTATANSFRQRLNGFNEWPTRAADKVFLVERLGKAAAKLEKDAKANEFDHSDIEKGLHELRRRIRAIAIQIQSIDGLVVATQAPVHGYSLKTWLAKMEAETPDFYTSKYVKLSPPHIADPIKIPAQLYAMLAKIIGDIGKSKDVAEGYIFFEEALNASGASHADKSRVLLKLGAELGSETLDHRALAKDLQNQLVKTGLLAEFEKGLLEINPSEAPAER